MGYGYYEADRSEQDCSLLAPRNFPQASGGLGGRRDDGGGICGQRNGCGVRRRVATRCGRRARFRFGVGGLRAVAPPTRLRGPGGHRGGVTTPPVLPEIDRVWRGTTGARKIHPE